MKTYQTPKESAGKAYGIMQQMAIASGFTIKELAEANGCSCGYELQKKIQHDIETN